MRSFWFRALALSVVVSQFLVVPTAVACAAEHTRAASHCGTGSHADDAAVLPDHGAQAPSSCTVSMACRAPAPALLGTTALLGVPGAAFASPGGAALAFESYQPSPTPPPPQA